MSGYDVAIVGGGIAGISLAYHLRKAGRSVVLFEKSPTPQRASVRNFGMVWEVGQATPEIEALAQRSHEHWRAASAEFGFSHRTVGSLHLAYEPLELAVVEEYLALVPDARGRKMLSAQEAVEKVPVIRQNGLLGALYSETEGSVDPREVAPKVLPALVKIGVEVRIDSPVAKVEKGQVLLSSGESVNADQIVVSAGPELYNVLPEAWTQAGLKECRLQMLRLKPRSGTPRLNIHLCAGLTLGHYGNFRRCPSLPALLEFQKQKWPKQMQHGIHILISEHEDGMITLGDSHDYGRGGPVYQEEDVSEAILSAMDEFLPRELYEVSQRWQGAYPTHDSKPYWFDQVDTDIWAVSLFGTGMTLSWGVTELLAKELQNNAS